MEIMVLNYLNLNNNVEDLNEGPACAEIARLDFHLDLEKIKQNKQKTWCTICTLHMRWPVTSRKQKSEFREPRVTQQESAVTYSVMEKL